jgi:spore maturation protein CgeB
MRIAVITKFNLYESKRHFALKLAEALERQGAEVLFLDLDDGFSHEDLKAFLDFKPRFSLSFNTSVKDAKGKFMWDYLKVPHLSILVDPPVYNLDLIESPYSLISCVDKGDVAFLKSRGFEKVFFLPHAVEKDLFLSPEVERPYDVVFLGSCYDYEASLEQLPPIAGKILAETDLSFTDAILKHAPERITDLDFVFAIDNYIRGKERADLIRSIKDATVHLYGDIGWQKQAKARPWQEILGGQPNVVFHPSVSYQESLEILKKSKLSLNSMPFFKNGTHERLFAGLAAGSLPMTLPNLWTEENFKPAEIGIIRSLNSQVNEWLSHAPLRYSMVQEGQKKVQAYHTWDQRAKTIINEILTKNY